MDDVEISQSPATDAQANPPAAVGNPSVNQLLNRVAAMEAMMMRIVAALEKAAQPPCEGLSPAAAAAFLGISLAKLHELNATGKMPAPVQLGDRLPRWSRVELSAWFAAGGPPREMWQSMRLQKMRNVG